MDMPVPSGTVDQAEERRQRPPRRKLILRLSIMALLLVIVLGGLYAFDQFRQKMIAQFFANNVPPPTPVTAVAAATESMVRYLEGIGTLKAVQQVTVSPEVNGRITKILFEAGATVKAGDPLVQLNDEPEQADLANFRAQEHLAQVTLTRSRSLATQQFTAQQTVDQNQSQLDVARASIARTQAVIAQKLVRAPFAGQLGVRMVDVGQYLSAGTPIVSLTNLDVLHVDFTLPEQARASLAVDQQVEIRADAFGSRVFPARITTIEPQVDPDMRAIKVEATLENPRHLLLPGMFAATRVVLPAQPNVVTVPETAVDYSLYGESVYILRENGKRKDGKPVYKAEQAFVKTGPRHDGKIAITEGVKPGDLLVSVGQLKLHNGALAVLTDEGVLAKPSATPIN
jgi:membrane fusion protein, multidrug efflux system